MPLRPARSHPADLPMRSVAAAGALLLSGLLWGCAEGANGADAPPAAEEAAPPGGVTEAPVVAIPTQAAPLAVADSNRARVTVRGLDLTAIGYDLGRPDAPIQVVEFSDFGCGFCAAFARETEPVLVREFVETGHVYWKYVPFVIGMFPNGAEAARAAECAGAQGRFWAAKDSLYAGQRRWKQASAAAPVFTALVMSAGVQEAAFERCVATDPHRQRTSQANAAAARLGVRATPTFFINGQMVEGALPLTVFRGGLRQMLAERGIAVPSR